MYYIPCMYYSYLHPNVSACQHSIFIYFLQSATLIHPSQKVLMFLIFLKKMLFFTKMELWEFFVLAIYLQYKSKLLGKGYGTNCNLLFKGISLDAHFLVHFFLTHCLSKFYIFNFVHHRF